MPVYEYRARRERPEFRFERGSMVARDSKEVIDFLKEDYFYDIRIHRLHGLQSIWKRLTADIS